jgi:hypothetical protein
MRVSRMGNKSLSRPAKKHGATLLYQTSLIEQVPDLALVG